MALSLEDICLAVVLAYSALGWLVLTGIKLNYGRLSNSLANVYIPPQLSWFIMEVPNLILIIYFLFYLKNPLTLPFALFMIHYINRDIVYPLRMNSITKVPIEIMLSGCGFTFANAYLQGIANQQSPDHSWVQVLFGTVIFMLGMGMNIHSDNILQTVKAKLVKQGSKRYVRIDQFLFKWIANPNYLGEIIEWIGYAVASGNVYAWLFVFSTINILTPAAMVRNKWSKQNIVNYPSQRKAILPFVI